jgi:ribosome maturation factor RimP
MEHLIARTVIDRQIRDLITPPVEELGFEIVRVRYVDGKNPTLQIMLDKENNGIEIAECAKLSITISTLIDVSDPIKNEYNLEVSSPGINRPLTRRKDFDTWEGYDVKIKTNELIEQRKNFKGVLRGISKNEILLEVIEGIIGLNFDWIDEASLSISIEKILKESKVEKTHSLNENEFDKIEID